MADCQIFSDELAIRYPAHGRALWDPHPGGLYDAVQVGDVGFIREGIFHRLFNALDSTNPPQLQPRLPSHIRMGRDDHDFFHSSNVTLSRESERHAIT
jgi:hypothetical protein